MEKTLYVSGEPISVRASSTLQIGDEVDQMALYTLEKFDCEGDVSSVAVRWEQWKRGLYIYMDVAAVDTEVKKRACLLHFGGTELQEVFYNIPGAHVTADEDSRERVFEIAIEKLDEYFSPKQSKVYERHMFRLLKQEPQEKFEKFLVRLRQQARKCQFASMDESIIDQITEKCASDELRKKILKIGDKITLDEILTEANSLEIIDRQLVNFGSKGGDIQGVNKISVRPDKEENTNRRREPCSRCRSTRHFARDTTCPARNKSCLKCGIVGHFRNQCRTKPTQKRRSGSEVNEESKRGRKRYKETNNVEEIMANVELTTKHTEYIFNVNSDASVRAEIGGVGVEMLIDSGCSHNLITDRTWEMLKENNARVSNQDRNPQKNFIAYGSTNPLEYEGHSKQI
ncbi:hypothetical protein NQ315_012333 [Exocentrus adspersus]|uniref:CCHC-type domain-containing protein n=1 Tax=Exocentrus adspersus TaxID=1586481 RepID=A0AAV8V8J6_9CUCU|nr:hypothetical protein NQ315_012333 [Exocentrus adspersus]